MEIRRSEAAKKNKAFHLNYSWVSLEKIPVLLTQAVLVSEDDRFYEHHGFDWQELRNAILSKKKHKPLRGASTISQQLVKNLYLSPERSIFRKLNEVILTVKLERCLSKKRILECYLNIIELGNGLFGVEAASRFYFSKSVSDLSLQESLQLVSVIPKPLKESPRSHSQYIKWRMKWIADRLQKKGFISEQQYMNIVENRLYFP